MKKTALGFLSVVAIFFSSGCGKNCRDAACPNLAPPFFAFRLTNSTDKDLLTGPAKIYDTSQLRIRAKRNNSTTIENINRVFNFTGDTLALTGFTVDNNYAVYYLQLNGTITDSLFYRFNESATACCDLSSFTFNQFNNTTITPVKLPATFVIKK
jgi:hypothetical protein